jgi:Flp pilus assembly pilin Flp
MYESFGAGNSSILGISAATIIFNLLSVPTSIGGDRDQTRSTENMLNIVEKYSAETAVETEDGVVAIEYVLVAAAVVAALALIFSAFGDTLNDRLIEIVDGV